MDLVRYPRIPCSRQQVQQRQRLQLQLWVRLQHPITLALEELALLPLCGLPVYRAIRTLRVPILLYPK